MFYTILPVIPAVVINISEKPYGVNQPKKHVLLKWFDENETEYVVYNAHTFSHYVHLHNLMNPFHCNAVPSAPGTQNDSLS